MKAKRIFTGTLMTLCLVLGLLLVPANSTPVFAADKVTLTFNLEIAAGYNMPGVWPFRLVRYVFSTCYLH